MISIICPTFNESENIPPLLARLDDAMAQITADYEVVIVDDDSPDGTYEVARELADEYPVTVVRRTEVQGLASAVVRGIHEAAGDRLVVTDADLQHPPTLIPKLISKLADADIVVGSRLAEGGSFGDFSILRRGMTICANLLAHICLSDARRVQDVQSGFFAMKRSVVADSALSPTGYKILLEILVVGDYDEVTEVGYKFRERSAGDSSIGLDTIIDYIYHLSDLWIRSR